MNYDPTKVIVVSEVRGTTLQSYRQQRGTSTESPKLIVGSEVTSTDSPKIIVGSKVRVPTPQSYRQQRGTSTDSPKLIMK